MKILKILFLLVSTVLSACSSYNDVKLNVLNAETKESIGHTYVIVNDVRSMLPTPFRQQKLYKTNSVGELVIDRDRVFDIIAISDGYASSTIYVNNYKNADPTKDGFVPKTILMHKSDSQQSVSLESYIIKDYDADPLTKEFIDYCFSNKIKIYRWGSKYLFKLDHDK